MTITAALPDQEVPVQSGTKWPAVPVIIAAANIS